MSNIKDEVIYVTDWVNVKGRKQDKKQNTEGDDMSNKKAEGTVLKYKENGLTIAEGGDSTEVVRNYLEKELGYKLSQDLNEYEWRDFPRNTNYEVSELGFVRHKNKGRIVIPSIKGKYEEGRKENWRIRVTFVENIITPKGKVKTIRKSLYVSQMVAETFLGDKPESKDGDYIVSHKNDIPLDNRVENLEYITKYKNKTIDWVLREIGLRGLTLSYVDAVFEQIKEVIEDKYGLKVEDVGELTDEDIEEVQDYIEVYKRTVRDIYNYKVYGTGVLSRIGVDGDRFIL